MSEALPPGGVFPGRFCGQEPGGLQVAVPGKEQTGMAAIEGGDGVLEQPQLGAVAHPAPVKEADGIGGIPDWPNAGEVAAAEPLGVGHTGRLESYPSLQKIHSKQKKPTESFQSPEHSSGPRCFCRSFLPGMVPPQEEKWQRRAGRKGQVFS